MDRKPDVVEYTFPEAESHRRADNEATNSMPIITSWPRTAELLEPENRLDT